MLLQENGVHLSALSTEQRHTDFLFSMKPAYVVIFITVFPALRQ